MPTLSRRSLFVLSLLPLTAACISGTLILMGDASSGDTLKTDILIYGSSLGGTSAAIVAAEQGANVILASDDFTVGGQAVESGMSAFDDTGRGWENWGLYTDLQKFLWTRSKNADGYHAGLGIPQVGRVSSIPADISAFFLERIRKNSAITLLTGHTISDLKKKNGKWHEATLTDTRNNEQKHVRFQYLVDGTMTGRLFEQTATPFRIGMDTAEETGEKYALPKMVRDAFVGGIHLNSKQFTGLGNRVQAITSPFALLDHGYPGEFIPIPLEGNACLSSDVTVVSLIAGAQVFRMEPDTCQAQIVLAPEFSDTYDIYLVQHGSGSVRVAVASPLWSAHSLMRSIRFGPKEEPVSIGSFPLSREYPITLTVTPSSGDPQVEGLLLVKKNISFPPVVLQRPQAWDIPLVSYDAPSAFADIYLTGSAFPPNPSLLIGGKTAAPSEANPTTIRFSHVSLRGKPVLSLSPDIRLTLSGIVIIPTAFDLTPMRFSSATPDKEMKPENLPSSSTLKNTDAPVREWRFTSPEEGVTAFSIETTDTQWRRMELWQDQPEQLLKSLTFSAQSNTRNPQPIFSAVLNKGTVYRLRIGLPSGVPEWSPFFLSANAVNGSPVLFTDAPTKSVIVSPPNYEGVYDIWAEGTPSSSVSYTVLRPGSPDNSMTIPVTRNQFQYVGKVFLDNSTTLTLKESGFALLAVPNANVDTYQWSGSITDDSPHLTLPRMSPGAYRMTIAGGSMGSGQMIASLGNGPSPQQLSLPRTPTITGRRLVAETLISNGSPLTLSFDPSFAQSPLSIHLYREIPDLQNATSFSMLQHPLLGIKGVGVPLFFFRNIVTGANVLDRKPEGLLPPYIGRDTLGMTLVVNPSNDFAGFRAELIDSPEVAHSSRALSAAYAYWMLYDSALTSSNLNCNPTHLLCTTKRIHPVIGLFEDKLSMFPLQPYTREGRRLVAKSMITQNDIGASIRNCDPGGCPEHCRPINDQNRSCILEEQSPVLFPDALATAGYGMDLHAFIEPKEYFATVKPFVSEMEKQVPKDSLALLRGIWGYPFAKPAEIPLGALLPAENTHLFPASHNIGTSQIANGLFRIHINELAIGQTIGHVLSYCLGHQMEPQALTGSVLRAFQHNLIEYGVVIYPITDAYTQLLRKPVQHLIAEGFLVPRVVLTADVNTEIMNVMDYMVFPEKPVDSQDAKILSLFSLGEATKATYRDLVLTLHPDLKKDPNESVLQAAAVKDAIVDKQHLPLAAGELLSSTPSKGDLYRAAYLLMRDQWVEKLAPSPSGNSSS
ncbi:MAG: FAD-dependent oxidoreductase [Candidatus Peribacteraceae bacterium]|nr:FAD-dependent oxidoreductase [Candidatus Peribacteraceae bacterium]MDD5742004.1 FAD-dependent oxidoreductase [Candidatus Peribacteraceae bacterium]